MKKTFLFTIVFLFASNIAFAQAIETTPRTSATVGDSPIQKGNWMVGGSLGSAGYHIQGKSFHLSVNPKVGYFLSDDIAVGVTTHVALYATKNADNLWNYGVGPFARYYIPGGEHAAGKFFGEGRVGISSNSSVKEATFAYGAGLGYAHFVTKSVALEVFTGYNYNKSSYEGATANSQIDFSLGFQIYLSGKR